MGALVCLAAMTWLQATRPLAHAADLTPNELIRQLMADRPPNLILIVADDLGYGDLGSYGQTNIHTPHLDRLAAEGMRFTQFYAGSSLGAPSQAALLTGLDSGHVPLTVSERPVLKASVPTLAAVLRQGEYQTGLIGKWALGYEIPNEPPVGAPHEHGFDEWLGTLGTARSQDYYPTYLWRSTRNGLRTNHVVVLDSNLDGQRGAYSPDYFTMAATNYIRGSRYEPFFLYLSYPTPHANLDLTLSTLNGMEAPSDIPYTQKDWPQAEKNKAAMITRLDRSVNLLMKQIRKYNLETNTVILFTSDNGPHSQGGNDAGFFASAGPFRGEKGDLLEGGLRVPLIAYAPGLIPSGVVSTQVWAALDLLPTLADIAEVQPPRGLDGLSFKATLMGEVETNHHDHLYWELPRVGQAIRQGRWKAIKPLDGLPLELYDLDSDPGESNNVAADHPDVVAQLDSLLTSRRAKGRAPRPKNP